MSKLLSRLCGTSGLKASGPASLLDPAKTTTIVDVHAPLEATIGLAVQPLPNKKMVTSRPDISSGVHGLSCDLSGLDPHEIKPNSGLVDLGIDSLMGMEPAREVENIFKCTLEKSDLLDLTDFKSLTNYFQAALGLESDSTTTENQVRQRKRWRIQSHSQMDCRQRRMVFQRM